MVVFPAPVWPTTAMVSPGSMRKLTSLEHPVLVFIREPDVIEFDGGGGLRKSRRLGGRLNQRGSVEQLEDALGGGHGRLHDVVLFAQVLDGAEESQAVLEEGNHHADLNGAAAHSKSAVGEQQRERQHAEKLGDRIKPAVGGDGVLVGFHVVAIDACKLAAAASLAIEELEDGDAADVLLQIGINARDGHANFAVALLHGAPELHGDQHHQRHHGQQESGHAGAQFEHRDRRRSRASAGRPGS